MKKHVLILGAGFGGLELATRLSESYADAVRVTLIDRSESFFFGLSKLEVMLGRQSSDAVRLPYDDIVKDDVEFRHQTVTAIHPATRRVTTDSSSYEPDFVVVASARLRHGRRAGAPRVVEYYTWAGRSGCGRSGGFEGGKVVVSVLGQPFKCRRRRSRERSSCTSVRAAGHPRLGADDDDVPMQRPVP